MAEDHTELDSPKQPRSLRLLDGLYFLKFFGLAGIAGLFLVGYSYANTFYDRFGLALHEVGIGHLETIEFTTYLFQDYRVVIGAISVVVIFSLLAAWAGYSFENFGFYLSVAILFLLVSFISVYSGALLADNYATKIVQGTHGRPAYCLLKQGSDFPQDFRASFERVTNESRMVKIKETKTMLYVFVVPQADRRETSDHGESLSIQKSDISHCRVGGTRSWSNR